MMRAASGMLVATLISTCGFSGALAKYVVADGVSDAARVAKFGVVVTAAGSLFGDSYGAGDTIQKYTNANQESVSTASAGTLVVAPGTKNNKGMTFTVKGTPEVSTKLTMEDAAKGGKPIVNTDLKLKAGAYSIMVAVESANAVITADNVGQYYKYATTGGGTFTQLANSDLTNGLDATVYKKVALTVTTDGAANKMDNDYLPITWTVDGTALTGTDNTVAGVKTAVVKKVTGNTDASNIATKKPGEQWNGTSKVTWAWAFSDALPAGGAWTTTATDVIDGWENTTLKDMEDTVLGQMIALATDTSNTTYKIASGDAEVKYAEVDAATGSANKVWVAYTGATAPTVASANDLACLTATFGARVVVEQVDNPTP